MLIQVRKGSSGLVLQSTSDEMTAAPRSCPCSSQRHQSGSQQTARIEKSSVEEPLFSKCAIYCFQGYWISWSVSESGLARACHKGEPKRLRLRVVMEARGGDRKEQGIPEEACCVLGHTGLPLEKMLYFRASAGLTWHWANTGMRHDAGNEDKFPVGPTLPFQLHL